MTDKPLTIPRIIGHRGAAALATENSLAGFRRAAAVGCRWVEFDVRLTGDLQPVVFHDDTVDRLTGASGAVATMPLERLLTLRARGEPIPTLAQTLAALRELGLGGNLEMKAEPGRETALAAAIAAALAGMAVPLLVSSFSVAALDAFAKVAPATPRGLLVERLPAAWQELASRLGMAALIIDHRNLSSPQARAIRDAGFRLGVYTVNDPRRARELLGWGVDAIITDAPDILLAALPPS
jgi:glycerophosphoryl diester phosphodiesterase